MATKKSIADFVQVTVATSFDAGQSDAINRKFVWSYEVTIENHSEIILQLLNRFWRITDLTGYVEEVRGVGVIGMQPLIKPGRRFVYSSFCQLSTPQGTMEGYYEMQDLEENLHEITIPKFVLSAPTVHTLSYRSILH